MPKVYKNRKKFIDPRYFLNETTHRDLLEFLPGESGGMPDISMLSSLNQYKEIICQNQDKFKAVIRALPEKTSAAMIVSTVGLDRVPMAQDAVQAMISIYNGDENVRMAMDKGLGLFCNMPSIPKLPF